MEADHEAIMATIFSPVPRTEAVYPPEDPDLAELSDEIYKLICPYSLEIMADPRTLPCGHTFDYSSLSKLAEEGDGWITCVVCRARFEADPRNLDVNLVTKQIFEGIRKLNAKRQVICDRCSRRTARIACQDCGMLYCQTCFDLVHQGRLKEHRWNFLDVAVQRDLPFSTIPGHEEYRLDLYCPATNEFVDILSQATTHRDMECYPVMRAAHYAKEDLQEWIVEAGQRKMKLKTVTEAIDKVVAGLEQRAEDELTTLEELVTAFIDKIEAQAKQVSDKIIENKLGEIDKLCLVRKQVVNHVANMVDDIARAERAINLNDSIELILMDKEIVKNPPPLTIHLPQYTVPWVGPEGSFEQLFNVDFLPAQDPCWQDPCFQDVVVPPQGTEKMNLLTDNTETHGVLSDGQKVSCEASWGLDQLDRGAHIVLRSDGQGAHTVTNDDYVQSTVFGGVAMHAGIWMWKIRFDGLVKSYKQVCYGVALKPFDQESLRPFKNIWGWSSSGCALPAHETRCDDAKILNGDEVWVRYDAELGKVEAYWPRTGMSGNIDIGAKAARRAVYPVFNLGRQGNAVEVSCEGWSVENC